MATTTINATYQGKVDYTDVTSKTPFDWNADIRTQAIGTSAITYTSNALISGAIGAYNITTKGLYYAGCYRTFLFFDVSSITATGTITDCTLKVLGFTNTSGYVIPVKAEAWGGNGSASTLSAADYSQLDWSIPFADTNSGVWDATGYNDFTLNTDAIDQMNNNGYLNCALINEGFDQQDATCALGDEEYNGVEFLDGTNKIKLDITYTTGYGNGVIGVSSTNIAYVIGVATANIDKVIGV